MIATKDAAGARRTRRAGRRGGGLLSEATLHPDGKQVARAAGLRYVSDTRPGIRRRRVGKHFSYRGPEGERVTDPETLARIRSLAIPPAWTDVWICPHPNGHIQVTGRDARGRKQYRYHPRWREVQDETKYDRMLLFAHALPQLRARVEDDLGLPGLPRERVLATVVRLLDRTYIRVGNEDYARQNQSYGLTTLRDEHVEVEGTRLRFQFRGKSGKEHTIDLRDRRVASIIRRCQALPGQELFQYVNGDGLPHAITSCDVNTYLRERSGQDFTAKDFRTWGGTQLAFVFLRDLPEAETDTQAKKNVVEAIRRVSERLGNTAAVCRKCYVHPAVLEAYLNEDTRPVLRAVSIPESEPTGLEPDEAALVTFLNLQLGRDPVHLPECAELRAAA